MNYYEQRVEEEKEELLVLQGILSEYQASGEALAGLLVTSMVCEFAARKARHRDNERKAGARSVDKFGRTFSHTNLPGNLVGGAKEREEAGERASREVVEGLGLENVQRQPLPLKDPRTGQDIYICPFYNERFRDTVEAVRQRFHTRYVVRARKAGRAVRRGLLAEIGGCPFLGRRKEDEYQTQNGPRYRCLAGELIGPNAVVYRLLQAGRGDKIMGGRRSDRNGYNGAANRRPP